MGVPNSRVQTGENIAASINSAHAPLLLIRLRRKQREGGASRVARTLSSYHLFLDMLSREVMYPTLPQEKLAGGWEREKTCWKDMEEWQDQRDRF